ncbi:MAG: RagB/SusD family nutrient uptake outer membrane protein [Tannerellaceae bacterium]|nr:RagB/SusD family nutrient uptake outer membrane protein [Tannerellaceae bacterium]
MNLNINKIAKTVFCIAGIMSLASCNDSYMDRFPETSITDRVFFNSPKDLETFTNGMYGYIGSNYWDVASDNVVYIENSSIYNMMRGEVNEKNAGKWSGSWSSIRTVNYMLNRTDRVQGDQVEKNHYIGIARMFRAQLYYNLVKKYSDVPWYSSDLQTTDTELLYKTQDSRAVVVDSIMEDLDFAVENIKSGSSKTRIFKNAALAIQARIALNEGTFRKYHPELNLSNGDQFLQIAADACKKIMDSKSYSLSKTKQGDIPAYESLFCSLDLTQNPEMILIEDYDKTLGRMHNAQAMFDWTTSLSRDLMEDYLVIKDGKVIPFQQVENYDKKTVLEIFDNRDPRLGQTFMMPGFTRAGAPLPARPKLSLGGYPQVKFSPRSYDQISWGLSYTDLPVIRYAEVLLMYAEAKAELGTFTQADMDATINLIRQRAGVPTSTLSEWLTTIDPVQANRYANVNSSQKGAVLEIRRERRIELACEGFRYGDLMRWANGKLLEKAPEGCYIDKLGYRDITGDGLPDIAVVATQADASQIPQADKDTYKLTVYVLAGNTFDLTEGTKGYIRQISQVGKFHFEEPKYYYYPLDEQDILVNENLVQNKYWK